MGSEREWSWSAAFPSEEQSVREGKNTVVIMSASPPPTASTPRWQTMTTSMAVMPFGTALLPAKYYFCVGVCFWRGLGEASSPVSLCSLHFCHGQPARESGASVSVFPLKRSSLLPKQFAPSLDCCRDQNILSWNWNPSSFSFRNRLFLTTCHISLSYSNVLRPVQPKH